MMEQVTFEPEWAIPPGATISGILQRKKVPIADFAWEMELAEQDVEALCEGRIALSDRIAQKLEQILGVSAEFWIVREAQYRSDANKLAERIPPSDAQAWIRDLPLKDMVAYGWIEHYQNQSEQLAECLRFFDVSSIPHFEKRINSVADRTKFRTSGTFTSKRHAVGAWLRFGELTAQQIICEPWNPLRLRKLLPEMRKLTLLREPQIFLPKLRALCAASGIALVIARTPSGCRASGATMFITETKAMILLSFRHLSDDHFWFSFFHECGHLLLHPKEMVVVEGEADKNDPMEKEANEFAEDVLIPAPWKQLLDKLRPNRNSIVRFAVRAGISPGIVVGQLEHRKIIDHKFLSYLKRRYTWGD